MKRAFYTFLCCSCILTGCRVGPVYRTPNICVPCEWHSEAPFCSDATIPDNVTWWECLEDPILNELMAYAAEQNLDLKIAAIRVLQARSEVKGKKADLYPHIDASAGYAHVYYSKDALVNGLIGTVVPVDDDHVRRNVNFYEVGFDAEWELDFFGLTAHEIAALKAHAEGVQDNLCGVWVTLSAEIARNYIELRGLQQRLEILKRSHEIQTESLSLTQELLERGVVSESDYKKVLAESNVLEAELFPIKLSIDQAIHRLSVLLGYPPGELFECLCEVKCLPELPSELCIGVPSELLRRRPDIRKAERELAAATERVGSAIAALFPRFSLRGFVGDISTHAGSLFNPASATWFVGPQLLLPIFNSRLLLQDVAYNKLSTKEALYTYQKTVLEALEEAENAISSFQTQEERLCNLTEAYQSNQKVFTYAEDLYNQGITDKFALAKAEKELLSSEDAAVQSQVELLLNYVSLYKALGGSWDCEGCAEES